LTGLWQVKGKNRTTFEQMMELDLKYVETKSLLLDVFILASTPLAILTQAMDVRTLRKAAAKVAVKTAPRGLPQFGGHRKILQSLLWSDNSE
jgi:hypothetical protein